MINTKLLACCVLMFLCSVSAMAQSAERKVQTDGYVADSFTDVPISGVLVSLMTPDSVVVDTFRTMNMMYGAWYAFALPRKKLHYLLRFEHKDYDTHVLEYYHKPVRHDMMQFPKALLKRRQQKWDVRLDEVVVKATKIKVAHKGDTIVFDATAFNVAEGSMLDGLIRQMPGVELKPNGEIFVNGEKIDYMLLNGQEFYRGNNKLMLDNLPYYMVQNIKVYRRATDRVKYAGLKHEKGDHVMDVNLKRQYRDGYIANAEAGGGTEDTYLGRLFGLRFTDHSRLSVIGNINNLNAKYQPNTNGDWHGRGDFGRDGRTTRKEVTAGLMIDSRNWKNNIEATVGWTKTESAERSNTETFLPGDSSLLSQSNANGVNNSFVTTATNNFTLKVPFYLTSQTSFTHSTGDGISSMRYLSQPSSQYTRTDRNNRSLSLSQSLGTVYKLATGDVLDLNASARYTNSRDKAMEERNTTFTTSSRQSLISVHTPLHTYNYNVGSTYTLHDLNHGAYSLNISYDQEHKSENELRTDIRTGLQDEDNSYRFNQMQRTFNATLRYTFHEWNKRDAEILLPVRYVNRSTHYVKSATDTTANQRQWLFSPKLQFGWKYYTFVAGYTQEMPDAMQLINTSNTNDPLHTYLGNPDLKNPGTLNATFRYIYDHFWDKGKQILMWVRWNKMYNQVMQSYAYNPQTGQFTYRPRNVDGNWNASINAYYNRRLGKTSPFSIGSDLNMSFSRTRDYSGIGMEESSELRDIKYLNLDEELKFAYEQDGNLVMLRGRVQSFRSDSDSPSFETVNAMHYTYGVEANLKLPLDISLETSLMMEQRRGYTTSSLNTDECVWNMTVGRSFLKGKRLLVRLTAIDILRNYSAVSYRVSSSGRTETWRYSLPAYCLLRATYKFNLNPKDKK